MGLGRFVEGWSKYGIQALVLLSLLLQVLLFILPILRRHKMLEKRVRLARLFKLLLWLAYQLADSTAIYVLGHMAISSGSPSGEVMALWASVLLVHLGGQDTITAYSLEDNRLWKRHVLTLGAQAAGVAYVLSEHIVVGGGQRQQSSLRSASALMFIVGILKVVERILVLRWSSDMNKVVFTSHAYLDSIGPREDMPEEARQEDMLKEAHSMLYFCMCQFVDNTNGRLSGDQKRLVSESTTEERLFELVHLQLSLMHDLLYTKAAAIHTWFGCLIRAFSWVVMVIAWKLVFLSGSIVYGGRRFDAGVTYALLAGAFLLETASSLKALGSTWTCDTLRSRGWGLLLHVVLGCRRRVRAAEWSRKWRGYIGGNFGLQKDPEIRLVVKQVKEMVTEYKNMKIDRTVDESSAPVQDGSEMNNSSSSRPSQDDLDVDRKEKLKLMNNSKGRLSLERLKLSPTLKVTLEQVQFDEYLVLWYHATNDCIKEYRRKFQHLKLETLETEDLDILRRGVNQMSSYMMYLFKKQPHMLPPPVRQQRCPNSSEEDRNRPNGVYQNLKNELSSFNGTQVQGLKAILWVWIEMLCYAGSQCNRESHARELSNGSPEFATVLWVLRAALLNAIVPGPESVVCTDPNCRGSRVPWYRRLLNQFKY